MILAAFIDGWALKVPNWVTLPLILSGWMLGLLPRLRRRGRRAAPAASGWPSSAPSSGSCLLFPMLVIRGVGEGDVKMQMGFGAWVGAFFGTGATTEAAGLEFGSTAWVWCSGRSSSGRSSAGLFGLIMILIRRQFRENARMCRRDHATTSSCSPRARRRQATKRAEERRKVWVKLPYGIPLCVGFLLYLGYVLVLRT